MNISLKISLESLKQSVIILLVLAPFMFPTGLQYSSSFHFFYYGILYYWRIAACAYCLLLYFYKSIKKKTSVSSVMFFICICTLLFSTVIQHASISSFFSTWGGFFCFFVGSEYFFDADLKLFCQIIRKWLLFIAILNLLTMIINRDGMPLDNLTIINSDTQYTWLWGFKNSLCNLIIPLLAFTFTCSYIDNKKALCFTNILALVISLFTGLFSHSSTLLIVTIVIFVFFLLYRFSLMRNIITIKKMLFVGVTVSVLIVFFNIQNLFGWLIEGVLEKDLSLTNRTTLWGYALEDISHSLFFGYGVQDGLTFGLLRFSNSYSHCHNAILTLLYQGGLLSLITYAVFFVYIVFYKEKSSNSLIEYELGILLLAQMLFHISGSISGSGFFSLLLLISKKEQIQSVIQKMHYKEMEKNEK